MTDADDLIALAHRCIEPWNRADVDAIVDAPVLGAGAQGFGFRTRDARLDIPDEVLRQVLRAWFDGMERYRIEDVEIDCHIDGDHAVLFGHWTEDFRTVGGEPERVRVRFSNVVRRADGGWESVWNHRDIQDFTDEGAYVTRPIG